MLILRSYLKRAVSSNCAAGMVNRIRNIIHKWRSSVSRSIRIAFPGPCSTTFRALTCYCSPYVQPIAARPANLAPFMLGTFP